DRVDGITDVRRVSKLTSLDQAPVPEEKARDDAMLQHDAAMYAAWRLRDTLDQLLVQQREPAQEAGAEFVALLGMKLHANEIVARKRRNDLATVRRRRHDVVAAAAVHRIRVHEVEPMLGQPVSSEVGTLLVAVDQVPAHVRHAQVRVIPPESSRVRVEP